MRIVIAIAFALVMAACASLIPTDQRTIELPTEKYRQPELTAKEAILKVRESCDKYGRFTVDGETYECHRRSR